MYRLETFGKLALSGGSSGKLSQQRRRLALLALLAAAGERGLSRDQLLAYLWADSSATNARHSLEQLLYAMRRVLGDVFAGVNPIRLDPAAVASDVAEFEHAVAGGDWSAAVAVYDGPFLDGFYLEDAPEFERWMESERARLAARYTECLGHLADAAHAAGDLSAAVVWRRRLVEADPVSSRSALGYLKALVASGDRTAALQHARVYETLVRQELESEPDPSITAYVAKLRAGADDERDSRRVVTPERGITALVAPVAGTLTAAAPTDVAAPIPPTSDAPTPAFVGASPSSQRGQPAMGGGAATHPRRRWWIAGVSMSAALLAAVALFARQPDGSSSLDANRIVVVPFRTSGSDSVVAYLAEGVVDLLAPMLAGDGGPVAVDSRTAISTWNRITRGREGTADDARRVARELGAGLALTGAIVDVGGTLTIAGTIITADRGGDRSLTSVSAPRDSVNALLDRFVGQLLARQSGVPEPSLAAVTSQSLPAIRAYLAGRAAYRRADEDLAIERFTRALDIDSTFALAALDLAVATGKLLRARLCADDTCRVFSIVPGLVLLSERVDDQFDRAVRLAWDSRSRLGRRDRPLLDAYRGANFPRESSARETMTNLRRAVGAAPDRPEAHYLLGVFLLYQGPALGYSDSPAQAEAAFHNASRLDSSYLAPVARLVDVAALERDTAKLQRAGAVYLARDSAGPMADYVRWLVAVGTGDAAAHQEIRARLRSLNRTTLQQIYLTSQMTGLALDDADTSAELLIDATADALDRSVALRRAQLLALNRGRPARAAEYLRRVREAGRSDFQYRNFAILAALFDDGDRAIADSSVRRAAIVLARDTLGPMSADMAGEVEQAMVSQAMWDIEHGDTARLRAAIDWLRRHGAEQPRSRGLIALPEMLVASRDGRPDGARLRAFVDSIALGGCCELSAYGSLALARAYEASGDTAAALRVVRRGIWLFPPRALTAHLREEGRLAARLGDRSGAIRAYEHYLALRSDPEPGLRAARDSVRAEVKRLQRR